MASPGSFRAAVHAALSSSGAVNQFIMGRPVEVRLDGCDVTLEEVAMAHASLDDGTWRDVAFCMPSGGGSDITLRLTPLL